MDELILLVSVEPDEGRRLRVLSPSVGRWAEAPAPGSPLGPGSFVGTLTRLRRRFELQLPEGSSGRVVELADRRVRPVEYGEPLFHLDPLGGPAARGGARQARGAGAAGSAAAPRSIVSPTDGVFYRRPAPGAPPFVDVGSKLHPGQTIGLVEVMKTFNQILYGGAGLPAEAEVLEILSTDGEEVHAGQALITFR